MLSRFAAEGKAKMVFTEDEDSQECARLELELLTFEQRHFLDNEASPQWDLNPPQREEWVTPRDYILALGRYADAASERIRKVKARGHKATP